MNSLTGTSGKAITPTFSTSTIRCLSKLLSTPTHGLCFALRFKLSALRQPIETAYQENLMTSGRKQSAERYNVTQEGCIIKPSGGCNLRLIAFRSAEGDRRIEGLQVFETEGCWIMMAYPIFGTFLQSQCCRSVSKLCAGLR